MKKKGKLTEITYFYFSRENLLMKHFRVILPLWRWLHDIIAQVRLIFMKTILYVVISVYTKLLITFVLTIKIEYIYTYIYCEFYYTTYIYCTVNYSTVNIITPLTFFQKIPENSSLIFKFVVLYYKLIKTRVIHTKIWNNNKLFNVELHKKLLVSTMSSFCLNHSQYLPGNRFIQISYKIPGYVVPFSLKYFKTFFSISGSMFNLKYAQLYSNLDSGEARSSIPVLLPLPFH